MLVAHPPSRGGPFGVFVRQGRQHEALLDHEVMLALAIPEVEEALDGLLERRIGRAPEAEGDLQAVDDVLRRYEGELDGKVVIDITNPVDTETYAPLSIEAGSVAQEIAARVPGAKVVKAFNTTFAGTLVEGQVAGEELDVLLASDDEEAKNVVSRLASEGGMRPIDAGSLALAHNLEALSYLHMTIQPTLGTNYGSAFKVLA